MICPTEGGEAKELVSSAMAEAPQDDGWYLYGITRQSLGGSDPASTGGLELEVTDAALDLGPDHEPVQLLECGGIAAVVRRVALADFTAEALQARFGNPDELRLAVQMHNEVIRVVHRERAVLPAKFGAVYARLDDIVAAIERHAEALRAQLERLDGCDEWAVHVYVDRRLVRATVAADQALDSAQRQLATAGPGRAYFLRRKLEDDLAAKSAQVTEEIALAAYRRLGRLATDGIAERLASSAGDADGETEVLRAAFLVRRERGEEFVADVRAGAEDHRGWRSTYSGPWPPYSFAALPERDDDGHQDA